MRSELVTSHVSWNAISPLVSFAAVFLMSRNALWGERCVKYKRRLRRRLLVHDLSEKTNERLFRISREACISPPCEQSLFYLFPSYTKNI